MTRARLLTIALLGSALSHAQTGPLEPRMLMITMPSPAPMSQTDGANVIVEMSIDKQGKVVDVKEISSSGDAAYVEKVRKYCLKMRFVPALADDGTPIESKQQMRFKSTELKPFTNPDHMTDTAGNPFPSAATASGVAANKVFDEVERIGRMRCKDFAWEYDLMKDAAGSKPVYDERMLKTVRAMYMVQEKVDAEHLGTLNSQFPRAVRDSLDACRQKPDENFFRVVFVPTMKARMPR